MSGQKLGTRRARRVVQPVALPQLKPGEDVTDTRTDRALTMLSETVNALIDAPAFEDDVDLAVGTTTITHGLNRTPRFVQVAPKTADAAFAWGWDPAQPGNPRPTALIQITSTTAATVRIRVE